MLQGMQTRSTTRQVLLAKEGLAALVALALLSLAAALYPLEPVGAAPQAGHAEAPWLFLGLQELLRHLPALAAGLLIPAAALGLYAALPWLAGPGPDLPGWRRAWRPAEYLAWGVFLCWAGLTAWAGFNP